MLPDRGGTDQPPAGVPWAACPPLRWGRRRELVPLASMILPAVGKCHFRVAQAQRRLAALRCVEAVRLYAAAHGGKLPERLEQIREVPVPINPITGKPFGYRLEGETAVIEADGPADSAR